MATCKECIHYFACSAGGGLFNEKDESKEMLCNHFKNKADVVPVVRCKDCIYCISKNEYLICSATTNPNFVHLDHYCSFGERKDDNGNL